jgi:hypothetical protein
VVTITGVGGRAPPDSPRPTACRGGELFWVKITRSQDRRGRRPGIRQDQEADGPVDGVGVVHMYLDAGHRQG